MCKLEEIRMEFVPLNTRVLNYLARDDPVLKRYFYGTLPADKLPRHPNKRVSTGYIVNTDAVGEPGEHWLAIWTKNNVCEVMDSYGLPLATYTNPDLQRWFKQWKNVVQNQDTLQALDSQTCGHYALMYLKNRARGASMQEFLSQWRSDNLVLNDHRVSQEIRHLITQELDEEDTLPPSVQTNRSHQFFVTCHDCQ